MEPFDHGSQGKRTQILAWQIYQKAGPSSRVLNTFSTPAVVPVERLERI